MVCSNTDVNISTVPSAAEIKITFRGFEESNMAGQNSDHTHSDGMSKDGGIDPLTAEHIHQSTTRTANGLSGPSIIETDTTYSWFQCFLALLVVFSTLGLSTSFGVFQLYYEQNLGLPHYYVSWIGSSEVFLFFFLSVFSGRISDIGYTRVIVFSGSIMIVLGLVTLSFAAQFWQILLAQGVCIGIGGGLIINPAVMCSADYFTRQKAIALVISSTGGSLGGVLFPVLCEFLLPRVGFPWTIRTLALIDLVVLTVANLFLKQKKKTARSTNPRSWSAICETPCVLYTMGIFSSFLGIFCGLFYIGTYSKQVLNSTNAEALHLIIVVNAAGILGRLIVAFAGLKVDSIHLLLACVLGSALVTYAWTYVHGRSVLIGWCVCYGLVIAGAQGLAPAGVFSVCQDMRAPATMIGAVFTALSFGSLIGTPISGAWISLAEGGYIYAQMFAGSMMMMGFMLVLAAKMMSGRRQHRS